MAISHPLIVGTAPRGRTAQEDREHRMDQPDVFDRRARVLAAITARLLRGMLGTVEAPFGAIVAKRGEAAAGAAAVGTGRGGACLRSTMAVASTSATPRRLARSGTDRLGVSPRA